MLHILLSGIATTAYQQSCTIGAGNTNDWIGINAIVLFLLFGIAAIVYSLGNIFPAAMREKMKGAARVEIFQGIVGLMIIIFLIGISTSMCAVTQAFTSSLTSGSSSANLFTHQSYQDPIKFADDYIYNLLFVRSLSLFSTIYSQTITLVIWGNILEGITEVVIPLKLGTIGGAKIGADLSLNHSIVGVYFGFSGVLTGTFVGLIVVTFAILFVIYISIIIIEAAALTIVVPISIIMRCIPFAGPKLREAADSFLALAIAFYFIFPLAILVNNYVVAWLYTPCQQTSNPGILAAIDQNTLICNPYQQFSQGYKLGDLTISDFFKSDTIPTGGATGFGASSSFFGGGLGNLGGLGATIIDGFQILFTLPRVILGFAFILSQYLFESIFLIALDIIITVAFAQSLTKGLAGISRVMGVGPFWGSQ